MPKSQDKLRATKTVSPADLERRVRRLEAIANSYAVALKAEPALQIDYQDVLRAPDKYPVPAVLDIDAPGEPRRITRLEIAIAGLWIAVALGILDWILR